MLDDAVLRAMARWPNVPDVYGWLRLDRRGQWLIKDESIANATVRHFISRNYMRTDNGLFAFQNGPQRVFVALDYTPWIVSIQPNGQLQLHTGDAPQHMRTAYLDEVGRLLVEHDDGIALLDDRDLAAASEKFVHLDGEAMTQDEVEATIDALLDGQEPNLAIELAGQRLPVRFIASSEVAHRYSFQAGPSPDASLSHDTADNCAE
jgi:hypothetical protein